MTHYHYVLQIYTRLTGCIWLYKKSLLSYLPRLWTEVWVGGLAKTKNSKISPNQVTTASHSWAQNRGHVYL